MSAKVFFIISAPWSNFPAAYAECRGCDGSEWIFCHKSTRRDYRKIVEQCSDWLAAEEDCNLQIFSAVVTYLIIILQFAVSPSGQEICANATIT